jgi:predicted permease
MNIFRRLFGRKQLRGELNEEIQAHIEEKIDALVRGGMPREAAGRTARLEFGNPSLIEEDSQTVWRWSTLESFGADVRYALRAMRRNPGFTAVVILTLALGIGANVAIFSVVNAVLLQPLPYKDASRLVTIWGMNLPRGFTLDLISYQDYLDLKAQNHVFESMGASTDNMYTLTGAGEPAALIGYEFTPDYWETLGVPAYIGRTFSPDENENSKAHVAVLNYKLWATRFGCDRSVLGRSITLDGEPYTVIGVMPPSFGYPPDVQVWTPLSADSQTLKDRSVRWLRVTARMKPDVTMEQATTEVQTIAARLRDAYPKTNKDQEAKLIRLREMIAGDVRPALIVLLCSVGFVLLIACANIANLMLSRGTARQREIAVRTTLGATRSRMVRQFLTESVVFSLVGGVLGLLLAYKGAQALVAMFPPTISNLSIPRIQSIPIDGWVIAFAVVASIGTGLLFGLAPAMQSSRMNIGETLKESGRTESSGAQGRRFRNVLTVAEVALSLMLLAAAGLMIQSFLKLVQTDEGFRGDHVLTMRLFLPSSKYPDSARRLAFVRAALERIRAVPGVESAGTVTFLPLSGWWGTRTVTQAGRAVDPSGKDPRFVWDSADPGYFVAMKIPLIRGRYFNAQDNDSNEPVTILSASAAKAVFPDDDAIGKLVNVEGLDKPHRVVGIVADIYQLGVGVHQPGAEQAVKSEVYISEEQYPTFLMCLAIRTAGEPTSVSKDVQRAIWSVDSSQAISYVESMEQLMSETVALQRASMLLLAVFAGLALLLASIGIYGVISYSTSRRTREIGIRMALGAARRDVLRLVIGEGLALTLIGLVIGLAGALALTRFLKSMLFGVAANDPQTFVVVSAVLLCVGVAACLIPAVRAMRVDPMVALRYE